MENEQNSTSFDHYVKIILVGEAAVGKSSIIKRFTENSFEPNQLPTICVDFSTKSIDLVVEPYGPQRIRMSLWDTAGQEKYRTLTNAYYRGAQGVIICYDITSEESFHKLHSWLKEIEQHITDPKCVIMIVGTKLDLAKKNRKVSKESALVFASKRNLLHLECSALSGDHIDLVFDEIARQIVLASKEDSLYTRRKTSSTNLNSEKLRSGQTSSTSSSSSSNSLNSNRSPCQCT